MAPDNDRWLCKKTSIMVKTASLDYAVLRFEVIGCGLLFLLLAFLHCIFLSPRLSRDGLFSRYAAATRYILCIFNYTTYRDVRSVFNSTYVDDKETRILRELPHDQT